MQRNNVRLVTYGSKYHFLKSFPNNNDVMHYFCINCLLILKLKDSKVEKCEGCEVEFKKSEKLRFNVIKRLLNMQTRESLAAHKTKSLGGFLRIVELAGNREIPDPVSIK